MISPPVASALLHPRQHEFLKDMHVFCWSISLSGGRLSGQGFVLGQGDWQCEFYPNLHGTKTLKFKPPHAPRTLNPKPLNPKPPKPSTLHSRSLESGPGSLPHTAPEPPLLQSSPEPGRVYTLPSVDKNMGFRV